MRALIVGAERLGRVLATDLSQAGHDVRLLDEDLRRLASLPEGFEARIVHGSPLDRATLADAVAGCDAIAAVSPDDALNFVVAHAARRDLDVPLAVAVVGNPARAQALTGLGAHVICPTTRTAQELHLTLVRSGVESELLLGDAVGIYRAEAPARLSGRTVREIERPGELVPVAVEREGHLLIAVPELALSYGDVLHVIARDQDDVADLVRP